MPQCVFLSEKRGTDAKKRRNSNKKGYLRVPPQSGTLAGQCQTRVALATGFFAKKGAGTKYKRISGLGRWILDFGFETAE